MYFYRGLADTGGMCIYSDKRCFGKRTIDATYLSFWYKRQIIPAFSNYQLKTKEMLQAAYVLKDTEEGAEREAAIGHLKELYKEAFLSLQDVIILIMQFSIVA